MIQYEEYKVKLNNLKPTLDELHVALRTDDAKNEIDELEQKSAGGFAGVVRVGANAKGADGGCLLTGNVILGDIVADLSGDEGRDTHIRLARSEIADDDERSLSYGTAHVQLALTVRRQLRRGIVRIAADIALVIADAEDRAGRAVALDLHRQRVRFILQKRSHEGGHGKTAAQRGSHGFGGTVDLMCLLYDSGCIRADDADAAVLGHGAGENGCFFHRKSLSYFVAYTDIILFSVRAVNNSTAIPGGSP